MGCFGIGAHGRGATICRYCDRESVTLPSLNLSSLAGFAVGVADFRWCHGRLVRHLPQVPAISPRGRRDPRDAGLFRASPLPPDGRRQRPGRPGGGPVGRGRHPGGPTRARRGDAVGREPLFGGVGRGRRPRSVAAAALSRERGGRRPHHAGGGGGEEERPRRQRYGDQRFFGPMDQQSRASGAVRRHHRGPATGAVGRLPARSLRGPADGIDRPQHARHVPDRFLR